MERLTRKARYEAGYKLNRGAQIWQVIDRLAEYEDLGVTPEQIREIDRLYAEKCGEVEELKTKYEKTFSELEELDDKNREYQAEIMSMEWELRDAQNEIKLFKEKAVELKRFKDFFTNLYGEGLEVANWHRNGDTEPFDGFYDWAENLDGEGD